MTYREKLMQEHPEAIGDKWAGGCDGCPFTYGYEPRHDCEEECAICWDREIPDAPNQEAKADSGKPRLTLVPRKIIWDIAAVREWAIANKYHDEDNWKQVEAWRYREALYRHLLKYMDNPEGVDEETGLPILWHIATNVAFLCEMEGRK